METPQKNQLISTSGEANVQNPPQNITIFPYGSDFNINVSHDLGAHHPGRSECFLLLIQRNNFAMANHGKDSPIVNGC